MQLLRFIMQLLRFIMWYLIWWKEKTISPSVSQFNGISSCPVAIILLSCILRIEPVRDIIESR